jgi:hypothetical protein
MKLSSLLAFGAGAAAATSIALLIASGPEHTSQPDTVTPDEMDTMMEMSPEDMMAAMARIGTPDEHHEELGKLVGNWKAHAKFLMDPGAPMQESMGTMSIKWVLGGRFVKCDFNMEFMGQPFEGLAYTGYDIAHSQYVSTWMDTMSTKITYMEGNMDESGDMVMHGTATTPMGDNPMKIVSTWIDEDTTQDMFYDKMPDGTWMNTGSITYTRE